MRGHSASRFEVSNTSQVRRVREPGNVFVGPNVIPGWGQALREHPCRVQGSLRGRGVPSA